jgi:hypothetical protein
VSFFFLLADEGLVSKYWAREQGGPMITFLGVCLTIGYNCFSYRIKFSSHGCVTRHPSFFFHGKKWLKTIIFSIKFLRMNQRIKKN